MPYRSIPISARSSRQRPDAGHSPSQPDRWLPWLLGQVPAMILPREWETLSNFSSHPIGTGPYAVIRNTRNQLKIHAFDDFFGFRALIDEVNVWVLPDIGDEPNGGLTLKGPTEDEKAIESRTEEDAITCCSMPVPIAVPIRRSESGLVAHCRQAICFTTPMSSISATGSRPTVCCPAGITPDRATAKNPPGWRRSR